MMRYTFLFLLLIFVPKWVLSQATSLINTKSPDLEFENILNYKKSKGKLSDYNNKIIILNFWATWCAPCVQEFPHLENLQNEFTDDLQVLTVTSSDSEERINKFLTKFKTTLPIIINNSRTLKKVFPHRTISHTVLIDKKGIIKAITTPDKITPDIINKVLKNEPIDLVEKKDLPKNNRYDPQEHLLADSAIFQITLTGYRQGAPSYLQAFRNGRALFSNIPIAKIYEYAHGFQPAIRTLWNVKDIEKYSGENEELYSLEIIAPTKSETEVRQILVTHLNLNFDLKSKILNEKASVKILQRTNDTLKLKLADPKNSPNSGGYSGKGINVINAPISTLTRFLGNFLGIPVIDQTGLKGGYDINFPWYAEDPDNIHKELQKLGLKLVDANKKIDLLLLYEENSGKSIKDYQ